MYLPCIVRVKRYAWGLNDSSRAGEALMADDNKPLTMTVPEAGKKYFDLSRDSSYRAAGRGEIPTIRIGRLLRVPVRALERMLDQVECTGGAA
jgi:hypothetical protein